MVVSISSSSSITVSWSPPAGGADGHVILYNEATWLVEGGDQTSSLLTGLSEGQLYTIRVLAYKDLPSLLSDPVLVRIDGKKCKNYHYYFLYGIVEPNPTSSTSSTTSFVTQGL